MLNPVQSFGGSVDAFLAKINATGSALIYSSYVGESRLDRGLGIAVGGTGDVFIIGDTISEIFPT